MLCVIQKQTSVHYCTRTSVTTILKLASLALVYLSEQSAWGNPLLYSFSVRWTLTLTLLMALDRDTPGRPTSCLLLRPRTSNFLRLIFTSNGLFWISGAALDLRTLSETLLLNFCFCFPILTLRFSSGTEEINHNSDITWCLNLTAPSDTHMDTRTERRKHTHDRWWSPPAVRSGTTHRHTLCELPIDI